MPTLRARQLTPEESILAVSRHGNGVPVALIADQLGVPDEVVKAAIDKAKAARAARNGVTVPVAAPSAPTVVAQRLAAAAAAAEPAAEAPVRVDPADLHSIEELCEWADDAGVNRAGMLAERIRIAAGELRAMLRRREEIDSRKAKIAEAERVLRDARAELAQITGGRTANTPTGEAATIRKWAVDHGYEMPARGRIPVPIVAAYRAAN